MNQSQINDFLQCLKKIDDQNYLLLHEDLKHTGHEQHHKLKHNDEHDHDHEYDHEQSNSHNDLLVAKSTAMVVLFVASTLCGSIPFLLNRYFKWTDEKHTRTARSAAIIKSLLYFGGGVLMATTFLHLLPEVQEVVHVLQQCGTIKQFSFPLAEFLMCMGFYLMYLIEETIHACVHRHNKRLALNEDNSAAAAFRRGQSVRGSYLLRGSRHKNVDNNDDDDNDDGNKKHAEYQQNEDLNSTRPNSSSNVSTLVTLSVEDLVQTPKTSEEKFNATNDHHHQHQSHYHQHEDHEIACGHGHSHFSSTMQTSKQDDDVLASSLRGLFIVLALSLHELFEGMAIGLEGSASSVWFLFGAVSAHKLVLAFCVGVELIVARTRLTLSIIYVLTFAVVSPLGIGIGILVSHNSSGGSIEPTIASALLQGLACGTLLYVVFFEILSKQHNGLMAYFALLVGFACMFGLQQLVSDGHGHSHGACGSRTSVIYDTNSQHEHSHDHHKDNDNGDSHNFEQQLKILRKLSENKVKN